MQKQKNIFISYRREDSCWATLAAKQMLATRFGPHQIFIDVDTIEGGQDFVEAIDQALAECKVILVIISRDWLVDRQDRRRLEVPDDYVRMEIATALKRKLLVIPVLVDSAEMPSEQELPTDIQALHRCKAMHLRYADSGVDLKALINRLVRELNLPMASAPLLDMPWQERSDAVHSAQWLRYWNRHAEFVGRLEEMGELAKFYSSDERFSWYTIIGPGGVGKSRLALESLFALNTDWHRGFLKKEYRKDTQWQQWRPQMATAIVVDYAAQDTVWLTEWLDILCRADFE